MLIKIEAIAANESDSDIGAVTFGDPVRDLNRQRAKMSTTESLRVQIDALRIEKQQLEVENTRFREKQEWVNSGGNVSASTGLALSTSANSIGRRDVHGMTFSVGVL